MKSWKKILTVGAAVLGAVALTACSSNNSSGGSSSSNQKITLRVGSFDGGDGLKLDQQIAAGFMKEHPNVTVKIESDPSNYSTKLQTELAAGDAPDLFQLGDGDIASYVSKGALADMTSYVKGSNGLNLSDYITKIMDVGVVNGKYYTFGDYSTFAVYINKDMFQKAGLALPSDNWTWSDFEKDAKALTLSSGGQTTQWGAYFPATDLRTYLPFMYDYGGDVLSADGKTVTANSKGAIAGWEEYNQLMNVDKVAPGASALGANTADLFLSNKAAMELTGVWPAQSYIDGKMNFEVVPIPAGPSGQFTGLDYAGIGVNAKTKNMSTAWEYLKYWQTEGQDLLAKGGTLTAYKPANTKYHLDTNLGTATFVKVADNARMMPEKYNQYFAATAAVDLENVRVSIGNATGSIDVSSALTAATKKAQSDLDAAMKAGN